MIAAATLAPRGGGRFTRYPVPMQPEQRIDGPRAKEIRLDLGLTLTEASTLLDINPATLSRYEHSERLVPARYAVPLQTFTNDGIAEWRRRTGNRHRRGPQRHQTIEVGAVRSLGPNLTAWWEEAALTPGKCHLCEQPLPMGKQGRRLTVCPDPLCMQEYNNAARRDWTQRRKAAAEAKRAAQ